MERIKRMFEDRPAMSMGGIILIGLAIWLWSVVETSNAAYVGGKRAAQVGVPANANPYHALPESRRWLEGWMDVKEKTNE